MRSSQLTPALQVDKARAMGERERLSALRVDNEDKYGRDFAAN
jgi:hypothetical protein